MHLRYATPFHGLVRALSCIRRTGSYEAHRLSPIQKQLNSQFRPLRVSEKDYGRCCRAVRAASASMRRTDRADVCINACASVRCIACTRRSLSVASYGMAPGIKARARQVKASARRTRERQVDGDGSTVLNRLMNRYSRLF